MIFLYSFCFTIFGNLCNYSHYCHKQAIWTCKSAFECRFLIKSVCSIPKGYFHHKILPWMLFLTKWSPVAYFLNWWSHREVSHLRGRPLTEKSGPLAERPRHLKVRPGPLKFVLASECYSRAPANLDSLVTRSNFDRMWPKWINPIHGGNSF